MKLKISILGILVLIGGVLAAVGVFLDWATALGGAFGVTGWEIFKDGNEFIHNSGLIVLILAIVSILLVVLDIFGLIGKIDKKILTILFIIFGVLFVVLSYLTYNDLSGGLNIISMGIGVYLEFIAGIILILIPLLDLLGVLPQLKKG